MCNSKTKFCVLILLMVVFMVNAQNSISIRVHPKAGDNTQELISVLNADTNNKPLNIIISKGEYNIDKSLEIRRSNTQVIFESGAKLRVRKNNIYGLLVKNDNIHIENAFIEGNGVSADDIYSGSGIMILGGNNIVIKNSKFEKISGIPIFISKNNKGQGANNIKILNNKILNTALNVSQYGDEAGILIGYSGNNYYHQNILIEGNEIEGNNYLKVGIGLIGHGRNIIIKNNKVRNLLAYGILLYESEYTDVSLYNNYVLNNFIENIGEVGSKQTKKGMGIYLMKSTNSIVRDNKVINAMRNSDKSETLGSGSITLSGSSNTIVENNSIQKSGMYAITNAYSFDTKIVNNYIVDIEKSGIYLINVNNVIINGNVFKEVKQDIFKGFFEHTSLNYIKKMWKIDDYLDIATGTKINIENNIIYNPKLNVLYFRGTPKLEMYKGNINYVGNSVVRNKFINNRIIGGIQNKNKILFLEGNNNLIENNLWK